MAISSFLVLSEVIRHRFFYLTRSDLILPLIGCQAEEARLKRTRLMAWANPRSCKALIPNQFKSISYQRSP